MGASGFIVAMAILSGTEWVSSGPVVQSLRFEDGKLSTFTGCNRGFGDYVEIGMTLTLNVVGLTNIACLEEANANAEQKWLKQIQMVKSYAVENGDLKLLDETGATLTTLKSKTSR